MMSKLVGTYDVCIDCYTVSAGNPIEDWTPDEVPLNRLDSTEVAYPADDSDDGYFSMHPCPLCGSTLGGQRYTVAVLAK
jgi:hypothetical protein